MNPEETVKKEGFCSFLGESLSEIPPSVYLSRGLQSAGGPNSHCLLSFINFSDAPSLR